MDRMEEVFEEVCRIEATLTSVLTKLEDQTFPKNEKSGDSRYLLDDALRSVMRAKRSITRAIIQ